jgi:hypothetical protein
MRSLYKKLRVGVAKLKVDHGNALGYRTGMMGPGGTDEDHGRRPKKGKMMDQSRSASTAEVKIARGAQASTARQIQKTEVGQR